MLDATQPAALALLRGQGRRGVLDARRQGPEGDARRRRAGAHHRAHRRRVRRYDRRRVAQAHGAPHDVGRSAGRQGPLRHPQREPGVRSSRSRSNARRCRSNWRRSPARRTTWSAAAEPRMSQISRDEKDATKGLAVALEGPPVAGRPTDGRHRQDPPHLLSPRRFRRRRIPRRSSSSRATGTRSRTSASSAAAGSTSPATTAGARCGSATSPTRRPNGWRPPSTALHDRRRHPRIRGQEPAVLRRRRMWLGDQSYATYELELPVPRQAAGDGGGLAEVRRQPAVLRRADAGDGGAGRRRGPAGG